MREKKIVKKTESLKNNRRLIECETFVYPVGIKATQSVNESNFFSFATFVAAVYDR